MIDMRKPQKTKDCNTKDKIAIIGGGITGLFIGYFLVKKGYEVSLFEKEEYSGGALKTFGIEQDIPLEKFYHHILSFNRDLLLFFDTIGLSDNLIRNSCPVGIIKDSSIRPINSFRQIRLLKDMTVLKFLKTSWLGFNIFFFPKRKKWDKMTAEELIVNYCGETIWKQLCYPMIRAKFGHKYKDISGQWLVNKLRQKVRIRKDNSGEKLIYLKGSFQLLIDFLENYIRESGSHIYFQSTVENIFSENNKVSGLQVNGQKFVYDTIISTIAEPQFQRIARISITKEEPLPSDITYSHALCAVIRLKRRLSDYYWLYNLDNTIPFAAIIEHTNLTGTGMYKGESILYIARYLNSKKELYGFSDEKIIDDYLPYLNNIFPAFDKKDIIRSYIFRQPYAQPVFDKDYLKKKPLQESPLNGLFSVNMSQLYPQGRTLENCFLLARNFTDRF